MPRKVLRWAHEHGGVHTDCLISGKPCESCERVIISAFDHFYGHATDIGEVLALVVADYRQDILADEQEAPHA
jgi:hypothetical protein